MWKLPNGDVNGTIDRKIKGFYNKTKMKQNASFSFISTDCPIGNFAQL